jgi:hypothetical protein
MLVGMNSDWYEIWADEGHPIPYVLMLRPTSGGFEILDPASANKRVFQSPNYDDAKMWLLEDEFVLVGRKKLDE